MRGKITTARGRHATRGFIVVAVLWIVAALAALAGIYAVSVRIGAVSLTEYDRRLRAQAAAAAGVELAVARLAVAPKDRPFTGDFAFEIGGYTTKVEFQSENARIDLNLAPREMLLRVFAAAGADSDAAEAFANRVVARRTPADATEGEDVAFARSVGRTIGPTRGLFQHPYEIATLGIPADIVARALPYFTVYSGQAAINPLSASSDVLALLPGLTSARLAILLAQRNAPQDVLNAQLGAAASLVTFQPSPATRIRVTAPLSANRQITVETVVLVTEQDAEPYRVLTWMERFD